MKQEKRINYAERVAVLRAMNTIALSLNDEDYIMWWLQDGVPDGEIDDTTTDEELYWLVEDDNDFADLMNTFVKIMRKQPARRALYVDGIVSETIDIN